MNEPAALAVDRKNALDLCPVSRETQDRLDLLVQELRRWQRVKNLVGPATLNHVWTRHIADSLQLLTIEPEARTWLDLGSGAGFPGLVLAIALPAQSPDAVVHLVESNSRKCAFLRHVARLTGAPAIVHEGRIEEMAARFSSPSQRRPGEGKPPLNVSASPYPWAAGAASLNPLPYASCASSSAGEGTAAKQAGEGNEPVAPRPAPSDPSIDVVTARALAPLTKLLAWAQPLLTTGAVGLFPKGRDVDAELTEAAKSWTYTAELFPSRTDSDARIVRIRALSERR